MYFPRWGIVKRPIGKKIWWGMSPEMERESESKDGLDFSVEGDVGGWDSVDGERGAVPASPRPRKLNSPIPRNSTVVRRSAAGGAWQKQRRGTPRQRIRARTIQGKPRTALRF